MSRKSPKKLSLAKTKQTHDVNDYSSFGEMRQHAIACPGMYIGNINPEPKNSYVMQDNHIVVEEITVPDGFLRLYTEVMSNAIDNCIKSKKKGVSVGTIDVKMDDTSISVTNYGLGIPIETLPPDHDIYLPEMIFAHPMSGSNLSTTRVNEDGSITVVERKDREGSGVNGLGVKLVGIYSKKVAIELGDGKHKYTQQYHNNLGVIDPPNITRCTRKPWVTVQYWPDLAYFGYKDKFPEEVQRLFMKSVADASFLAGVKTTFNEHKFDFTKLENYAKLYYGDAATATYTSDDLTIVVAATPGVHQHCCFTNGIYNRDGGVHLDNSLDAVVAAIRGHYRDASTGNFIVLPAQIKNNISIIVNYQVTNPDLEGQSKNVLKGPWTKRGKKNAITLTDAAIKRLKAGGLDAALTSALHLANIKKISKTDGDKNKHFDVPKLIDANWARNREGKTEKCALFIAEGDSAAAMLKKAIQYMLNGTDGNGVLPLKGKIYNVRKRNMEKIIDKIVNNKEITAIKQSLGLKEGMEFKTQQDIYDNLRYGRVVVATDSDDDGKHILGLFINYIHFFFPSLLNLKFIYYLRTPLVIVYKNDRGDIAKKFYTESKFNEWQAANKNYNSDLIKYCKGLGSLDDPDIKHELVEGKGKGKEVMFQPDDTTDEHIQLAFSNEKGLTDMRKEWILNYTGSEEFEELKIMPITYFINNEFIQFSISDNIRSLPHAFDNLKDSQRKIIWSAMTCWTGNNMSRKKTVDFASYVSDKTGYHHGPMALVDAAVNMAQDFVSSNNLPLLKGSGQIGSRFGVGKDAAAPRYTFIVKSWCLDYLYPSKNRQLEVQQHIENKKTEPYHLYPILPVVLFNGTSGIGTGFSVFILPHHPLDVVKWFKNRLTGKVPPILTPWFRGFNGKTYVQVPTKKAVEKLLEKELTEAPELEEDAEQDMGPDNVGVQAGKKTLVVEGVYQIKGKDIIVTEIPIGRKTQSYIKYYESLAHDKKKNKDDDTEKYCNKFEDQMRGDTVDLRLIGVKDIGTHEQITEKLKLTRRFGMSNIVMLDFNMRPRRFEDVGQYCEYFTEHNLKFYQEIKNKEIQNYKNAIDTLTKRLNFFTDIINGNIPLSNAQGKPRSKADIMEDMQRLGHAASLAKETFKITGLTQDLLDKLSKQIQDTRTALAQLELKTVEQLWLQDIDDFERQYLKHYPGDKPNV